MKNTKIHAARYYLLADHPGISGFKDYSRKVETITTGRKARRERSLIVGEYLPNGGTFELHDGHLPGHRPIVPMAEAFQWLDQNPFQFISEIIEPKAQP